MHHTPYIIYKYIISHILYIIKPQYLPKGTSANESESGEVAGQGWQLAGQVVEGDVSRT